MRYELFEEVFSISSNDIREHDDVRCSIEPDDDDDDDARSDFF